MDYYLKNPLELIIYDPRTQEITQKKLSGGTYEDFDIFDTDIETIKKKQSILSTTRVSKYYPATIKRQSSNLKDKVNFYPNDSFVDVRNKINILTGIPIFRQHIIYSSKYYNSTNNPLSVYQQLYSIYVGNEYIVYSIINEFSGNQSNTIKGVPTDRTLYNNRSDLTVTVKDMSTLLEGTVKSVVVIDLFSILQPDAEFKTMSQYEFELIYYGMVFKFFPIISFDNYIAIYKDNMELRDSRIRINQDMYYKANILLLNTIKNKKHLANEYKSITNRSMYYITKATVNFNIPLLDNRMFIDKFKLNKFFVFIGTIIPVGTKNFLVTKVYGLFNKAILLNPRDLPKLAIFIQTSSMIKIVLYKNKCSINLNFNTKNVTYSNIYQQVKELYDFITKFITIRKNIVTNRTVKSITAIGKLYISASDVHMFWPRAVMSGDFSKLLDYINEYKIAGLLRLISIESGFYIIALDYGVKVNVLDLLEHIQVNNGYKYYTDPVYKEQYDAYRIKDITITQKASEVDIYFKDISEVEFTNNSQFVLNMLYNFMKNIKDSDYIGIGLNKKLKRLRTIDPELFDIKRHDTSREVYAVKCQLARQPVIYRSNEIKDASKKVKSRLVKFWNFTEKRHVYYDCPTNRYPHLSFRPQEHPLGYCLPCCKKKAPSTDSVQRAIDIECLKQYSIEATKLRDIIVLKKIETHYLSYGKSLDIGRKGYPPPMFADKTEYKLCGVQQIIPAFKNGGLVYSIVYALGITLEKFVKEILGYINQSTFDMLNIGGLKNVLTPNDLKTLLSNAILYTHSVSLNLADTSSINWIDVITELVYFTFAINVITILDIEVEFRMKLIRTTEVAILTEEKMNEYILLVQHKEGTYPLIDINKKDGNNAVFTLTDYPIQYTKKALESKIMYNTDLCTLNITTIITFVYHNKNYSIRYLLKGKRGYIYALILENTSMKQSGANPTDNYIYVPIIYTEFLSDEYDIIDTFIPKYYNLPQSTLYKFIEDFNRSIDNNLCKINFSYLLQHKDNIVAVAIQTGESSGYSYIFPHKGVSIKSKDTILVSNNNICLPIIDVPYDIISVNKAISNYTYKDAPIVKRASYYLYDINIYNLFLIEFSMSLREQKNNKIRHELDTEFKNVRININRVRDILVKHETDLSLIVQIINTNLTYNVRDIFKDMSFNFDMGVLTKLKNTKDKKERQQIIINTLSKNINIVATRPSDISNNFISCHYDQTQPQCNNQQLMITQDDYTKCVAKLADGIDNPYIYETLLSNITGQINPLVFTKNKFENLKIKEI